MSDDFRGAGGQFKCDKRTQNIESSVRMTVQKNIKKHVNTNTPAVIKQH